MNKKWMMDKIRQYAYMHELVVEAAKDDGEGGDDQYRKRCVWLHAIEDEIQKELDRLYEAKA